MDLSTQVLLGSAQPCLGLALPLPRLSPAEAQRLKFKDEKDNSTQFG
jgi:hypothetical protein